LGEKKEQTKKHLCIAIKFKLSATFLDGGDYKYSWQ